MGILDNPRISYTNEEQLVTDMKFWMNSSNGIEKLKNYNFYFLAETKDTFLIVFLTRDIMDHFSFFFVIHILLTDSIGPLTGCPIEN